MGASSPSATRPEGSLGAIQLASPIVYMAPTPDNGGYRLLSQDGTVYPFGDARNYGSVRGWSVPTTSLAATPSGAYLVLTADGAVHPFGDAENFWGDQWNGVAERFAQAKAQDKPIITGEVGILAGDGQSGCMSLEQRALDISAKMNAQFAAGDSAFLVWNSDLDPLGPCSYNTGPTDNSLLAALSSVMAEELRSSSSQCQMLLGRKRVRVPKRR